MSVILLDVVSRSINSDAMLSILPVYARVMYSNGNYCALHVPCCCLPYSPDNSQATAVAPRTHAVDMGMHLDCMLRKVDTEERLPLAVALVVGSLLVKRRSGH